MFATNLERSTLLNNAHTTWIMDFCTLCLTAFSLQHLVQMLVIIIIKLLLLLFIPILSLLSLVLILWIKKA